MAGPQRDEYNYIVNHNNVLNEKLLGTVDPFKYNYNGTDSIVGTRGKPAKAKWSGGSDSISPNMSFVVWRGKDVPTIASYKEQANHDLTKLGLPISKVPQTLREGTYQDNFMVGLRKNSMGDYTTVFECSHGVTATP